MRNNILYSLYYESAIKGKSLILESFDLDFLKHQADISYNDMKLLKINDMTKSIICCRIYEDGNLVYQQGSI